MSVVPLSALDLALAAALVLALAGLAWIGRLGVAGTLLVAAARTTVQLLLVGLVLKAVFAHADLLWVGGLALLMLLLAGREVMARQGRRFRGPWGYALGTLSMFVSAFAVTVFALTAVIGNTPWYEPRYAIPLLGMLLGNTMNGVAIGLDRLTAGAAEARAAIEARLALGARAAEAVAPLAREAVRAGLIPIVNAMSAAGVVSLPGMMTGQILAGTPPMEAVRYQVLIMFLIAAGTGFGTMAAVRLAARRLFDARERLRLDRLR